LAEREWRGTCNPKNIRMNLRSLISLSLFAFAICSSPYRLAGQSGWTTQPVCQNIILSPVNRSFTSEGGSTFINVYHENGCNFTATSSDGWINVTSVIVGDDIGTVYYSVASHFGSSPRVGAIAVGSRNFPVYQSNAPLQKAPSIAWKQNAHTASVNAVAFSPDGQLLASGSSDHTVKIWRVADGTLLQTLTGFYSSVTSVAFSHNGQTLAAGSIDRSVKGWNVSNWSLIRSVGTGDFMLSIAFSPDDAFLAAGGGYSGNWVHLIRTLNWEDIALFGAGQQQNPSIAYSPNGEYLAWAITGPGVRLQRVATGSFCMLSVPSYGGYSVNSIAFSPDGQQLASGSDNQSVDLWQVNSCALLHSFNGPAGFVKSVAYAPDGQTLLAGGEDYAAARGTLLLWRVTDGALLRVYIGETSTGVPSVQYSPNGAFFAYGREDGFVVLARNPFSSTIVRP
jgi:WD40 repeat protein